VTDALESAGAAGVAARGGALRAAVWVGSALLSLVSIPLLVRHLGVPEFGRYVAVLAVVNIAALASDLGLTAIALREWGAAEPAERAGRIRALLGIRLTVVMIAALCAIGFALIAGWPGRQVAGTAIASAGLFGQVYTDFATVGLAGSLRFGRVAAVEGARAAAGTLGIVILVVADAGLTPFFAAWAFAALATAALALRLAGTLVSPLPLMRRAHWAPMLVESAPYAAASAVHVVYFRAVVIVMSVQASALQAGLFAAVFRVAEFAAAVGTALAGTMTPVLAHAGRTDQARLRREGRRTIRILSAAGLAAALVLGLGAEPLMRLIGGHSTEGAVDAMRLLAAALIATFAAFGMGAVLLVLRRYRALLVINAAALVLVVALALALVPDHGAGGGAAAVLAGEWFIALAQAGVLWRAIAK
jgi:O-antigen/teichoic acid export membrane protein